MVDFKKYDSADDNGQLSFRYEEKRPAGQREFMGSGICRHVDDYCIVDLETTGVNVSYTKIIEIGAIKVRGNKIVDEFSTLVNPRCHIPEKATDINHITDEMVRDAPLLIDVIDSFLEFVRDDVIVGYNNAAFDMNIIYDSVLELKGIPFRNDFIDVHKAAKKSIKYIDSHKLETISKYYGLDTEGEHRALKDCYLTKDCYDRLFEEFGDNAFDVLYYSYSFSGKRNIQYSSETRALRELYALLKGILEDGVVKEDEVDPLRCWIEEHRELAGNYPFDRAFDALDDVLEDGRITPEELQCLRDIFAEIIDPVKCRSCHEDIPTLKEKHVCLTGDFDYGAKILVERLIEEAGGTIDKNVKKATDYLVVGAQGSGEWKTGSYGTKIQKAMDLNAKGRNIKIMEEKDFIPRVKYLIEHPEEAEECDDPAAMEAAPVREWKECIRSMLEQIVIEKELPEQSLYLTANYGQDGKKITSYSICIYEPEYLQPANAKKDPTRNSIVLNIKEMSKGRLELLVADHVFAAIGEEPDGAEIAHLKSDTVYTHVRFPVNSCALLPYIRKIAEFKIDRYISKSTPFGCCSMFIECSDAGHCVHENKLHSRACSYRNHLESGRIFYGKNKNVDKTEDDDTLTERGQNQMVVFTIKLQRSINGRKVTEEKEVPVETGTEGPGSAKSLTEADTDLRRLLGLPITKDLVYYSAEREECRKSVDRFVIDEIYDITDPWFTLILYTDDEIVKIHNRFFAEMQSPTYVSDMKNAKIEE